MICSYSNPGHMWLDKRTPSMPELQFRDLTDLTDRKDQILLPDKDPRNCAECPSDKDARFRVVLQDLDAHKTALGSDRGTSRLQEPSLGPIL